MPVEKKEQINFRVSARFRQRIESECIKREISLQDLVTTALKFYFEESPQPEGWIIIDAIPLPFPSGSEENDWVHMFVKYVRKMPHEKSQLIAEVLKLDLLHYRSSRRKAALRKRTEAKGKGKQEGDTNGETRAE
jgi:hypothetical protein